MKPVVFQVDGSILIQEGDRDILIKPRERSYFENLGELFDFIENRLQWQRNNG